MVKKYIVIGVRFGETQAWICEASSEYQAREKAKASGLCVTQVFDCP